MVISDEFVLFLVDPHDRFFEQENNLEFFTTNLEPQSVAGPIRRRVSSLFGETKTEGRYYEPQKITDEALMDVRIHSSQPPKLLFLPL